jgi:thiol-disulfide isomerase/thioredoxin
MNDFHIIGNLKGIGNSKLYLGKIGDYFMNVQIVDSFVCNNDSFKYKTKVPKSEDLYCIQDINGQFLYFLPDNDKITINGNSNNLIASSLAGSENNALLADYWKSSSLISDQIMRLFSFLNKAQEEHDTIMINTITKQRDSLLSIMQILPEKFIQDNYNKTASAVILYLYLGQYRSDTLKLKRLYAKLDKKIEDSPISKKIKDYLISLESCGIGKPFVDCELVNPEDKRITISSLKGKCFLIEFWTTWCGPCRGELPTLSKAYDKYRVKGFEIISISLDNSTQKWKDVVQMQKVNWIQTIIKNPERYKGYLAPFESDVAKAYAVLRVPSNYLVSSDGLIIAADLRGEGLLNKLKEIYKE